MANLFAETMVLGFYNKICNFFFFNFQTVYSNNEGFSFFVRPTYYELAMGIRLCISDQVKFVQFDQSNALGQLLYSILVMTSSIRLNL